MAIGRGREEKMYILTEQIMNGTVTMEILSTGIDAKTFEDAVKKVKNLPGLSKATICADSESGFGYLISSQCSCYGRMENKVLKII